MDDPDKGYTVIPCMDVYKGNIQSGASPEKLKLIIVVRGDFQNKEIIGYTWDPTVSMMNLKYFLSYYDKQKSIVHQLYLIGEFIQANIKHRVFVKLDSRYGEYFPEHVNYFGRVLSIDK